MVVPSTQVALSLVTPSISRCIALAAASRVSRVQRSCSRRPFVSLFAPSTIKSSIHRCNTCRWMSRSNGDVSVTGQMINENLFAGQALVGNNVPLALESLYQADCVCFDVDSTVVNEEGIDVLADFLGQGEQVAKLTRQAMEGGMKFQDALTLRLNLLQPKYQSIQDCLAQHPLQLTQGVQELVQALQHSQKDVWLVSGGFRLMIEPVAAALNIPTTQIVANTLRFDTLTGKYEGFDPTEPTSADMGKPKALAAIQKQKQYQTMVMIGDGATDAQAKPPASTFIGFGGVVIRQAAKDASDWFVTDFDPLVKVVQYKR